MEGRDYDIGELQACFFTAAGSDLGCLRLL